MDREISKPQPEEAAGVNFENVGSICQSIDDKSGCKDEEESGSSASRGRKSFSFITGRVFLKRKWNVKNLSEKPEPDIDQEAEYVNKEYQDMEEEGILMEIIADRNPSEEAAVDDEVMGEAVRNEKEGAREDSMLYLLESPSFRVYCVHNVSVDGEIDLNQKIIN
ncbi:hypothetical protein OIU84_028290 [Salix udensis]|uniref:Uncharacterized protein n=1 Tax=Salix udensis TaxID=889485 RepID=A0AAD6P984_9ROSI|nr:hypothetical protein OIU84_028290 [Salix udensis]